MTNDRKSTTDDHNYIYSNVAGEVSACDGKTLIIPAPVFPTSGNLNPINFATITCYENAYTTKRPDGYSELNADYYTYGTEIKYKITFDISYRRDIIYLCEDAATPQKTRYQNTAYRIQISNLIYSELIDKELEPEQVRSMFVQDNPTENYLEDKVNGVTFIFVF